MLNHHAGRTLGGFKHKVALRLIGKHLRRFPDGRWEYPPLGEAIIEDSMEEVEMYIMQRQNIVTKYIATWTIMGLCEEAERQTWTQVSNLWWDQEGINMTG